MIERNDNLSSFQLLSNCKEKHGSCSLMSSFIPPTSCEERRLLTALLAVSSLLLQSFVDSQPLLYAVEQKHRPTLLLPIIASFLMLATSRASARSAVSRSSCDEKGENELRQAEGEAATVFLATRSFSLFLRIISCLCSECLISTSVRGVSSGKPRAVSETAMKFPSPAFSSTLSMKPSVGPPATRAASPSASALLALSSSSRVLRACNCREQRGQGKVAARKRRNATKHQ